MIASNRKLSRLPLGIFEDLLTRHAAEGHTENDDPADLKSAICSRLRRFPVTTVNKHGGRSSTTCSIKTVGQLLQYSKYSLMVALDPILTYEEVHIFLRRVCQQCMPKPTTAKDLLEKTMDQEAVYEQVRTIQQSSCQTQSTANDDERRSGSADRMDPLAFGSRLRFLPTGLSQLDEHLQGGIRLGTVTEIVGEAGVGKTQLGLQLCVMAARYNQGAIYVDTENKLPVPRLRQMGQEWRKRDAGLSCLSNEQQSQTGTGFAFTYNQGGTFPTPSTQRDLSASQASQSGGSHHMPNDAIGSFKSSEQLLDNLTVHTATSTKELLSRLMSLEDEILQRNQIASVGGTGQEDGGKYPVRLLIVDSIAAPMRRDFGTDSAPQRSVAIFQCAQTLKRLADQLHLAVVVINQVGSADLVGGAVAGGHRSARDLLLSYRAALGTSWYHCVSTRLVLETVHTHQQHSAGADANSPLMAGPSRQLSICKSHMTGYVAMPFAVSNMGIVD